MNLVNIVGASALKNLLTMQHSHLVTDHQKNVDLQLWIDCGLACNSGNLIVLNLWEFATKNGDLHSLK